MKLKFSLFFLSCLSLILSIWYFRDMYQFWSFQKLYTQENYQEAENTLREKNNLDAITLHNLGNTLYKASLGASKTDGLLEKSLESYSGSLQKAEHPDTRYNYEFIKKLITETETNQQEKQDTNQNQQSQQQDTKSQQDTASGSQTGSGSTQNTDPVMKNQRSEEYKMQEAQKIEQLSAQEQQALDETIQALQEEQKVNQQFFGKQVPEKSEFEKRFESLFGGNEEKDW